MHTSAESHASGFECGTFSKFYSVASPYSLTTHPCEHLSNPDSLIGLMRIRLSEENSLLIHQFFAVNFCDHRENKKRRWNLFCILEKVTRRVLSSAAQLPRSGRAVQLGAAEGTPGDLCPSRGWSRQLLCTYSSLATNLLHCTPFPSCLSYSTLSSLCPLHQKKKSYIVFRVLCGVTQVEAVTI